MFSDISGRVVSTFENPNVLAEYLIMILPIAAAGFLTSKNTSQKLSFLMIGGILGACLIFTWSRGAWLATLLGLGICALLRLRRHPGWIVCALLLLPCLLLVLPSAVTERFLSIFNAADSTVLYRFDIWRASLSMLRDHLFTGIGVGSDAFASVLSSYTPSLSAPHSHRPRVDLQHL